MYLWVPLPDGVPSQLFARTAMLESGTIVLPGAGFGPAGEGFFRIALTVPPERLAQGVARLGDVLARTAWEELAARA
jgi:LL-diaminopimelate aminotransferase